MTFSFWIHEPVELGDFDEWDPDREPQRFASAVGHNIVELAKRVEALGAAVRVGEDRVSRGSLLVFFLRDAYSSAPALRHSLRAVHQARGRFVVVRSDAPSDWSFPLRPVREFMPTRSSVEKSWQRWVPPLTQRGLVPRRESRRGHIRRLALKGNKSNVPALVRTREWEEALATRDIGWWLDMSVRPDSSDQAWHDFADVDAVLCAHNPENLHDPVRKPATKLINAWVAGCVPVAERMPAYLELGTEGRDVLFLDDLRSCGGLLERLDSDPSRLASLERRVAERGREYLIERTSRLWLDALLEASDASEVGGFSRSARMMAVAEKRLAHLAREAVSAAGRAHD